LSFIDDRKDRLSNEVYPRILEFNAKRSFVSLFEKAGTELTMYLNGTANDSLS